MADDVDPRAGELTTANYGWTKPNVGDSDDAWGGMINADLDSIDSTVKSVSNVANAAYPASNPSGYQTAANVTASLAPYALTASVPAASSTTPAMDGTAAVGAGTTWARADHIHPTDTSRYATSNPSGYQTAAQVTAAVPVASSTTPAMDGTAAVGAGTTWARADHVHPTDTSRLALAGGTMTGALTPSQTAGIVGTTTNNNVNAGAVGEVISSTVNIGSGVALTNAATANVTSISLTAGDWDVSANFYANPAASTTMNFASGAISTVSLTMSATNPAGQALIALGPSGSSGAGNPIALSCGTVRLSLAATTTVYLVMLVSFAVSTCTGCGYLLARRAR